MRSLRSRAAKRRIRQLQSHQTLAIQSDIINPVTPVRSHLPHQILSTPSSPSDLIYPIRSFQHHQTPSDSRNSIRYYQPILSQPTSSKAADKTGTAPSDIICPIRYYLPHQTLAILSDFLRF